MVAHLHDEHPGGVHNMSCITGSLAKVLYLVIVLPFVGWITLASVKCLRSCLCMVVGGVDENYYGSYNAEYCT